MNFQVEDRNCIPEFGAPVLAICGLSGSGKTTLLEAALPHIVARGLSVAVVKHDAHGFTVDQEGKDSYRLFRAGATVALRGPAEQFHRRGTSSLLSLEATLEELARDHDLLLVEGHKSTPLPKIWLSSATVAIPPDDVTDVQEIFPWNTDRLNNFLKLLDEWIAKAWVSRCVRAGLLVGGESSRMGRPKQLLTFQGTPLSINAVRALDSGIYHHHLECCGKLAPPMNGDSRVVLLGAGVVPELLAGMIRLPDVPGLTGPIAGLLAAHRWEPHATWIVAACDHPWLSMEDIVWLLDQRRPGVWAVIPRQPDDQPCPTLALYEPQSLVVLERYLLSQGPDRARIAQLIDHARTVSRKCATRGIFNVNTPEDFVAEQALAQSGLATKLHMTTLRQGTATAQNRFSAYENRGQR